MKKIIGKVVVFLLAVNAIIILLITPSEKANIGECNEFACKVNNFRLFASIDLYEKKEKIGTIKGNIFNNIIIEPLQMVGKDGKETANTSYNFNKQNARYIYVKENLTAEMVKVEKLFGSEYIICNKEGEKIAELKVKEKNKEGKIYDNQGELIAEFFYNYFDANIVDIRISKKCKLEEETVIMIFSAYYSDQNNKRK